MAQGDGEATGTAIETLMAVALRFHLIKNTVIASLRAIIPAADPSQLAMPAEMPGHGYYQTSGTGPALRRRRDWSDPRRAVTPADAWPPSFAVTFAQEHEGEIMLYRLHIAEYSHGTWTNHQPRRTRKLLLHHVEIDRGEHAPPVMQPPPSRRQQELSRIAVVTHW